MSEQEGLPWKGALAALGMTAAVVAVGFVGVSGLQDPNRPIPAETQALQDAKRAATLEELGASGCGVSDLVVASEVHGPKGAGATFGADEDLTIWVAAVNDCDGTVEFTTPSLCLFEGFELTSEGTEPRRGGTMCGQMVTSWSLGPREAERASYRIGNLPAGSYRVTSTFAGNGAVAELAFAVQ